MNLKKHYIIRVVGALACAATVLLTRFVAAQTYDATLETLPEAQGFTRVDNGLAPNPTVSGGVLDQNTSGNSSARQWWYKYAENCATFDFSTGFTMEAELKVINSGYFTGFSFRRAGYEIAATDKTGRYLSINITSSGLWLDISGSSDAPPGGGTFFTPFESTAGFNNYRIVAKGTTATLYINGIEFLSVPLGGMVDDDPTDYNTASFGENTTFAGSQTQLAFFRFGGDNGTPTITCPANITTTTAPGQCSAVVNFPAPTTVDNCVPVTVSCSSASGSTFPIGPTTVNCTATDSSGNSANCSFTVTVNDQQPPSIVCPASLSVGCSLDRLAVVTYPAPAVSDNCDANPTVTCTPASGSASFPVGVTTVVCKAVDAAGNAGTCSFTVTRSPLGFAGFLSPIGGEVAHGTGGSFADPLRAFKLGSTIPVKFSASCGGSPVSAGVHTLQAAKYSNAVDSDPVIDATPTDAATTGNQFRLTDATTGQWHFNLSTKSLSAGTWKLAATLSDGTVHEVWITIKK